MQKQEGLATTSVGVREVMVATGEGYAKVGAV